MIIGNFQVTPSSQAPQGTILTRAKSNKTPGSVDVTYSNETLLVANVPREPVEEVKETAQTCQPTEQLDATDSE